MQRLALVLTLAAVFMMTQGCATITRGTTQDFGVTSNPSGADVSLSSGIACKTPCDLELERKRGFSASVTKTGYKEATFTVASEVSGGGTAGLAGNVLIGGFFGMGVDAASGAMNDLNPSQVHAELAPTDSTKSSIIVPMKEDEQGSESQRQIIAPSRDAKSRR